MDGQIGKERNFKDGMLYGKQTYWDENGNKQETTTVLMETKWSEDELFANGETIYNANCSGCHQKDGSGIPGVFPAMQGSEIANGPAADHLNIVINGKGGMPAFKMLGDAELASVITYERRAFGNNGTVVQPSDVVRKK